MIAKYIKCRKRVFLDVWNKAQDKIKQPYNN